MPSTETGSPSVELRRIRRRSFLQMGSLGALGLTLPQLLQAQASPTRNPSPRFGRAKRCILVFLNGGPSQLDMWDMKPQASADIRGELSPIATNVPGTHISELLPLTAQQADKYKIVRSVTHPCSVHTTGVYTMLTGKVHNTPNVDQTAALPGDHPHMGSVVSLARGWRNGMPPFVTLPMLFRAPPVTGIWPGQNAGFLGRGHDPFVVLGEKQTAEFTAPTISIPAGMNVERLDDRRTLLSQLGPSASVERIATTEGMDLFYDRAFLLLRSQQLNRALDLSREPQSLRDRYGRHLFGQGLLMARRLSEADIPLVTVYWIDPTPAGAGGGEYDSHGRIYHHMRNRLVPPTDRALSSLLSDMSSRGMLEETLVVVMGEFGRSPRINRDAGRDHWPQVQSILLAGAGISGGTLYGASDRIGGEVALNPVTPADLTQTIMHLLGVPGDLELHDLEGRAIQACDGAQVDGLLA